MPKFDSPLTIAQAFEELEKITQEFETGKLELESYVPKFKRATELAQFLKAELQKIDSQIEEIDIEGKEEN
jgi:exodeoxyribonuclease VII small subunit